MFTKHCPTTDDYTKPLPGIKQRTLVFGDKTLMTEFLLERNSVLPTHAHPYEQTGYLVKGHILLQIGDAKYDTHPGDSWCIPMNTQHGAEILEDSVAIEIFSPVRQDYLPKKSARTE